VFNVADGAATNDLEVSGAISGGNGLTKDGPGLMVLDSTTANSYTGQTTISNGTLQLGKGTGVGALATTSAIVDNGTLTFNRSNAVTQGTDFNTVISGLGGVNQIGGGTLTLSGANTYMGYTNVTNGTLS